MKGIVFVELLSMAEETVGEAAVDRVLDRCPLSSGGAFTSVGTYPASDLNAIVGGLSEETGASPADLQRAFGRWMLRRFAEGYAGFFQVHTDAFSLLDAVENEIHVEVRKLYPDAELPTFETVRVGLDTFKLTYRSPRRLIAFCEGLVAGVLEHYGQRGSIAVTDLSSEDMGVAEFVITLEAADGARAAIA
jgi:hypothetical protein